MPLHKIIDLGQDTKLGLWKIEEDADFYLSNLQLSEEEKKIVEQLKSPKRYLHWLASRVLIRSLLNTKEFIEMDFDEHGKPILKNFDYHISISHSSDYAGVIISKDHLVGLDIEEIDNKIDKIAYKFLSEKELSTLNGHDRIQTLHVYWGAKEAIYKTYGKGGISFKDNILIQPFQVNDKGDIKGKIIKDNVVDDFKVSYEKLNGYMLAYIYV